MSYRHIKIGILRVNYSEQIELYAINQQMDTYIYTCIHRQVILIGMLITRQITEVMQSSDKEKEMRKQPVQSIF